MFEEEFPKLDVLSIEKHTPFRYILSGGLSYKCPFPAFMHDIILNIEKSMSYFNKYLAMFQTIQLKKK